MKTKLFLLALIALVASSCSSTYNTANVDDVYYTGEDAVAESASGIESAEPDYYTGNAGEGSGEYADYEEPYYSTSETIEDPEGNTYVTNNHYYDPYMYDDYYDYSYAARIKRFHDPYYGFGYYDPYFTNSYWYNYNPWHFGTSIYMGYPYWSPSLAFSLSYGWGWGSIGMGWGYPY